MVLFTDICRMLIALFWLCCEDRWVTSHPTGKCSACVLNGVSFFFFITSIVGTIGFNGIRSLKASSLCSLPSSSFLFLLRFHYEFPFSFFVSSRINLLVSSYISTVKYCQRSITWHLNPSAFLSPAIIGSSQLKGKE